MQKLTLATMIVILPVLHSSSLIWHIGFKCSFTFYGKYIMTSWINGQYNCSVLILEGSKEKKKSSVKKVKSEKKVKSSKDSDDEADDSIEEEADGSSAGDSEGGTDEEAEALLTEVRV